MKEIIREYMRETFLFDFGDEIAEDDNLFTMGVLDSVGYIQLIKFLESEFDISFSEEEMLTDVLVSFTSIVDAVSKKARGFA